MHLAIFLERVFGTLNNIDNNKNNIVKKVNFDKIFIANITYNEKLFEKKPIRDSSNSSQLKTCLFLKKSGKKK